MSTRNLTFIEGVTGNILALAVIFAVPFAVFSQSDPDRLTGAMSILLLTTAYFGIGYLLEEYGKHVAGWAAAATAAFFFLIAGSAEGQPRSDEYSYFETAVVEEPSCVDGEVYGYNPYAVASDFEMNLVATGGALEVGGRLYVQHWELHDGPSLRESDNIMVIAVEAGTDRVCIVMVGVRGAF